MKSAEITEVFISVLSRGGLEVAELSFRSEVNAKDLLRNIPIDFICNQV